MQTLRQIIEQIIDRKAALDKLRKRKRIRYASQQIPTGNYFPNARLLDKDIPSYTHPREKKFYKVKSVDMDSIVTPQETVAKNKVREKIKGTKKNSPRIPMFLKLRSGQHFLLNGNHRAAAGKERERKQMRGMVADLDEYRADKKARKEKGLWGRLFKRKK